VPNIVCRNGIKGSRVARGCRLHYPREQYSTDLWGGNDGGDLNRRKGNDSRRRRRRRRRRSRRRVKSYNFVNLPSALDRIFL
jgi:hypothetical protein